MFGQPHPSSPLSSLPSSLFYEKRVCCFECVGLNLWWRTAPVSHQRQTKQEETEMRVVDMWWWEEEEERWSESKSCSCSRFLQFIIYCIYSGREYTHIRTAQCAACMPALSCLYWPSSHLIREWKSLTGQHNFLPSPSGSGFSPWNPSEFHCPQTLMCVNTVIHRSISSLC